MLVSTPLVLSFLYPLIEAHTAQCLSHYSAPKYSIQMAQSIMSRRQGIMTSAADVSAPLQAGITQKALHRLVQQYPNHTSTPSIKAHIVESVDSIVPFLNNATRDLSFSLDRLSNGNNLIALHDETDNAAYSATYEALHASVALNPRNANGGLQYFVYPHWSYLDGMYSFGPFTALYASHVGAPAARPAAVADIALQFAILWQRCHHNATNLLVHGYDYSKTAVWADATTGASPHVWSRSLGWFCMALVDTLELLPLPELASKLRRLAPALAAAADPASGAWWQVMDAPGRAGNFIESSGSAMFVYALLKGHRLGYLPDYGAVATKAYGYIVDNFVVVNGNATLGYNGTVATCSLNSTASYEYYTGRPILYNSVLGSGAFVLASLEYELLHKEC